MNTSSQSGIDTSLSNDPVIPGPGEAGRGDPSSSTAASFDSDLGALVRDLQQWRAECAAEPPSPEDFPPLDARALGQGSFFFAVDFILSALAFPNGRPLMDDSWPWLVIVTSTLVLAFGWGFFLGVIKAHGLHQRRFWRALRQSTGRADPFALTLLREMLDRDLKAARRLEVYALPALTAAKDRFSLTEETLRARVNLFSATRRSSCSPVCWAPRGAPGRTTGPTAAPSPFSWSRDPSACFCLACMAPS